ncbi:MAG: dienelactone hydrolase family protein [Bacteroidales bacterium]|jgi:predicted esterase|nr:dienelactone hydrolase family protein [Bacteroidales bacterium]
MKHILLLILFFSLFDTLYGQSKYNYQPSVEGFEYVEVTKGEDTEKLPLLIAFHYSSGNPIETIDDYDSINIPIRIIIPKGNYKKRDGFSYYPTDYYQKESLTQFYLSKITIDSLAQFVLAIEKEYKQKAIVSGISQGGDIAFLLAKYYPELCKASFAFAPVIHSNIIQELKNEPVSKKIPIFLFQGESDKIVPVYTTRKKVEEIGNRLQIILFTYPNVGHEISSQMKIDYSEIICNLIKY